MLSYTRISSRGQSSRVDDLPIMSKVTVHGPRVTSSIETVAAIRIRPGIVRGRRWTNRLASGIVRNEAPRIAALQVPADASVDVTDARKADHQPRVVAQPAQLLGVGHLRPHGIPRGR